MQTYPHRRHRHRHPHSQLWGLDKSAWTLLGFSQDQKSTAEKLIEIILISTLALTWPLV